MDVPMDMYILEGKIPVPLPNRHAESLRKWGEFMERGDRVVKKSRATISIGDEKLGFVDVSTVFLGVDHGFGSGPPLLFETMIFGGQMDGEMWRSSTWEEAELMHGKACQALAKHTGKIKGAILLPLE